MPQPDKVDGLEWSAVLRALGNHTLSSQRLEALRITLNSILMMRDLEGAEQRSGSRVLRPENPDKARVTMLQKDLEECREQLALSDWNAKEEMKECEDRIHQFYDAASEFDEILDTFKPVLMPEGLCWCLRWPDTPPEEQECTDKAWCSRIRKALHHWDNIAPAWPRTDRPPVEVPKPQPFTGSRCGRLFVYKGDTRPCRLSAGHQGYCNPRDSVP
jgi:hypothetical protein